MHAFLILAIFLSTIFYSQAGFARPQQRQSEPNKIEQTTAAEKNIRGHQDGEELVKEVADSELKVSGDKATASAGGVKVNKLENLEALLNIIGNGIEVLGMAIGIPACLLVPVGLFFLWSKGKRLWAAAMIFTGPTIVIFALAAPGVINWLFVSAREAALF